jgi:hypothetical protein
MLLSPDAFAKGWGIHEDCVVAPASGVDEEMGGGDAGWEQCRLNVSSEDLVCGKIGDSCGVAGV